MKQEHKLQDDLNDYESDLGNSDSRRGSVDSESEAGKAWERMCPSVTGKTHCMVSCLFRKKYGQTFSLHRKVSR